MRACYSGGMDEAIRNLLLSDSRVAFALIFGSTARRTTTSFSDVDVAIGLEPGACLDHRELGELTSRLEQAISTTIDLIILNEAPPGLAYRVFRDGRLVVEKNRAARVARQARAVLEYLDFKPVEEQFARAVLNAVNHG